MPQLARLIARRGTLLKPFELKLNSTQRSAFIFHLFTAELKHSRNRHLDPMTQPKCFFMSALQLLTLLISACFAGTTIAADQNVDVDNTVFGLWASEGSIFRTYYENNTVKGEILALREPVYTKEESPERAGQTRMDDKNPDESLRNRTIIGMNIYSDYVFQNGQWQGKIYDPESGNTYQSNMKLKSGVLEIRGYVGMPMFGRTAKFKAVESCTDEYAVMLTRIAPEDKASRNITVSCD